MHGSELKEQLHRFAKCIIELDRENSLLKEENNSLKRENDALRKELSSTQEATHHDRAQDCINEIRRIEMDCVRDGLIDGPPVLAERFEPKFIPMDPEEDSDDHFF